MKIRDWTISQDDTIEVVADVDGFDLWYRVPNTCPPTRSADPFVAAALLPAMVLGEELRVDKTLTVSPRLLQNLVRLQEIFHCWNPALAVIPIEATTAPAAPSKEGAFSFFSAGVDSMDTFFTYLDELSHAVFIHGFDFFDRSESYRTAVERNARFVAGYGKTLIPVETNFYDFGHRYSISRIVTQGACLGSVALLLGFATAYVPTTLAYDELIPLGSHPLTDPLWSNESVHVLHEGCGARRVEKTRKIAASEARLAQLHVCENDMNVNCGRCGKCVRTMVTLRLLGVRETTAFPSLPPLDVIARRVRHDDTELIFLREDLALPELAGDPEAAALRRALQGALKRAELRRAARNLDGALLGGRLRRLFVAPDTSRHIDIVPPRS